MTSSSNVDPWGDPAFEQRVRDTAYFMWEQDGQPNGKEQEYWYAALEKCLRQHDSDKELLSSLESREGVRWTITSMTSAENEMTKHSLENRQILLS